MWESMNTWTLPLSLSLLQKSFQTTFTLQWELSLYLMYLISRGHINFVSPSCLSLSELLHARTEIDSHQRIFKRSWRWMLELPKFRKILSLKIARRKYAFKVPEKRPSKREGERDYPNNKLLWMLTSEQLMIFFCLHL